MTKVVFLDPPPFKRFLHAADGTTLRVCRRCGAYVRGHNHGVCDKCLKEQGVSHVNGWNTGLGAAYAGSGSMALPSAACAVVFIRPTEKVKGVFELIAAKRGGKLKWKDADGNPTTSRYIAHSDKYIFWRDATPEEVEMFREYDCV